MLYIKFLKIGSQIKFQRIKNNLDIVKMLAKHQSDCIDARLICTCLLIFVEMKQIFCSLDLTVHYDNTPMQNTVIFHGRKNGNFQMKNCNIFLIFGQNIDRGYTLEPQH